MRRLAPLTSSPSLRDVLRVIVLAATACGGRLATDDATPSPSSTRPATNAPSASDDQDCPHYVELHGFDVVLSAAQACALASAAPGCFAAFCQPATTQCSAVCSGDPSINSCNLTDEYAVAFRVAQHGAGGAGDGGLACPNVGSTHDLTIRCAAKELRGKRASGCPIEGRRPHALAFESAPRPPPSSAAITSSSPIQSYFAASAWLEAASVDAFKELAHDLRRLDAPHNLVDACDDAAEDEARHTVAMLGLRDDFGVASVPSETEIGNDMMAADQPERSVFEIARHNLVEGVVRETFGAAVALFRAENARDEHVRRVLSSIADDECRHAELSEHVARFLEQHLSDDERDALERERVRAIAELYTSFAAACDEPPRMLVDTIGVPSRIEARALLAGLETVWLHERQLMM